jgi:hypothetical protein
MFMLTYHSMWYWYEYSRATDMINAEQQRIIRSYEKITGLYGANEELMQQNYDLKLGQCKDCVPNLTDCRASLEIFKSRSLRRGITIGVGIPVAVVAGYAAGRYVQSIKP